MPIIKRILCPTDFSQFSLQALEKAGEWATHFGAELCILHVTQPIEPIYSLEPYPGTVTWDIAAYEVALRAGAERELCEIVARQHFGAIKVCPLVREGQAAAEIVGVADTEKVDLIVIATHGVGGWRHLVFGSVAEKVIRLAPCPVLVTHPDKPAPE